MKLATYMDNGTESWGFVIDNPLDGQAWVLNPKKVELSLQPSPTNGYYRSMPAFNTQEWPDDLVGFLCLGDGAMEDLRRLDAFVRRYIMQSDQLLLLLSGRRVADIKLRAPIPRPRLMWGLVQNCPSFARNNPGRKICNFIPQGHQRPITSVVGHNEIFLNAAGFNVELGVVIGKKGKEIPVERAMDYVAGYTVVIDSQINDYYREFAPELDNPSRDIEIVYDWYAGATCSWGGKKSDAHCVMGPYLVTKDEIGNHYDLLVYTRQSGYLRDRSHTAGTLIGIERTIHWYSSFATLYPGDVIHMGTVGTDGCAVNEYMSFGSDDFIEAEIENIGTLRAKVLDIHHDNWLDARAEDHINFVPAAQDLVKCGKSEITPEQWSASSANNIWTCYGNYKGAFKSEGLRETVSPRFLNGPNTSIGVSGQTVELPKRSGDLRVGAELAFVVGKMAYMVKEEEAAEYILGYAAMLSILDLSMCSEVIEPATPQEKGICYVCGRWGDNYNIIGDVQPIPWREISDSRMVMRAGAGEYAAQINEYISNPEKVLSFISQHITLLPGDIVTLGRTANILHIPSCDAHDLTLYAKIDRVGESTVIISKINLLE